MVSMTSNTFVNQLVTWAKNQEDIEAVYLFGSSIAGRTNALSDVDVAVVARQGIEKQKLWRLEDRWSSQWPEWVDLSVLNLAPIDFQFEVITKGRRLWTRNMAQNAEYESWVRRRKWDLDTLIEQDWEIFARRQWEQRHETERAEYQNTYSQVRAIHQRVREASSTYDTDVSE